MEVNFLAIVLGAFSAFMLGGIWYGPLFGKLWMKENNFTEEYLNKRNMPMVFGISFIFAFISAFLLAMFIGDEGLAFSIFASLSVGLGWVACSFGTNYLFEKRSLRLFLINVGYNVIFFLLMGLFIGIL